MLLPNNTEINAELIAKRIGTLKSRAMSPPHFLETNMSDQATVNIAKNSREAQAMLPDSGSTAGTPINFSQRMQMLFAPETGLRQRIGLIPVLGSAIIWVNSIFRLNSIRQKIAMNFDAVKDNTQQLQDQIIQSRQVLGAQSAQLARADAKINALQMQLSSSQTRIVQLENASASSIHRVDALNLRNTEQENRLANLVSEMRLLQARAIAVPSVTTATDGTIPTQSVVPHESGIEVPGLDSFYVEFEDNFRGTSEDITARLQVYLPYLQRFSGDESATVVDIGCGRGEWLRLLEQNQIKAVGIDMNLAMVETCLEQGLSAHCLDAIDYLREQPEASLAAITGFHIIEHLPFKILLSLFDAALRALRPDGLIIFETPNPENLSVGACNFYFDPTHLNPIVPAVAQFMAKQRGFVKADILRLHPYPDDFKVVEDSELAKRFNSALYGPQDFAVIAWKSNAN
jgi:SAM-dependent methyltransferase